MAKNSQPTIGKKENLRDDEKELGFDYGGDFDDDDMSAKDELERKKLESKNRLMSAVQQYQPTSGAKGQSQFLGSSMNTSKSKAPNELHSLDDIKGSKS